MTRSLARRAFDAVRTVVFWCHLAAGVVAGAVVLIMSVTGVALAFQRQVLDRGLERYRLQAPPPGATRLPLDTILARARQVAGERGISGLSLRADSLMPVSVALEDRTSLFLDPYTGKVLGGDAAVRGVFSTIERVHRSIVFEGTTRSETGTAVTGASNMAFLFLILSGLLLWLPRWWSRPALRKILLFARGARGKARDWNWHHVLGIWCAPALLLIVASGAFISYEWPQRLVYRAFGEPEPAEGRGRGREGGRRRGGESRDGNARPQGDAGRVEALDTVVARAIASVASWHSVQLRFPSEPGRPISVSIAHTPAFRPDQRTTLTVDTRSGTVAERRSYEDLTPARRFRSWMRPLHTGEVGGLVGQAVAALASAAAAALVWTGIALAWRRLRAAVRRREPERDEQPRGPLAA